MKQEMRTVAILRDLSHRVSTRKQQSENNERAALARAEATLYEAQRAKEKRIANRWRIEAAANETVVNMLSSVIESAYRA
jgi:hypothetical protein